jgi:hypothetical protein
MHHILESHFIVRLYKSNIQQSQQKKYEGPINKSKKTPKFFQNFFDIKIELI